MRINISNQIIKKRKRKATVVVQQKSNLKAASCSNMNGNVVSQGSHLLKNSNRPITPESFKNKNVLLELQGGKKERETKQGTKNSHA